ncbi:MAG: phosphoribosylformylglycinamidine cyclo-ligase [Candidatus Obscuribacterales bacterium]|nr:phosphoribosylformylglycinamidine cyclo-ligase [Candidatus Obscuribacterales bacterium]
MKKETYASSGVQIDKAESFVERLKLLARRPEHGQLWPAAGGYAAVYPFAPDLGIAVTTDGVGTKLLVAEALNKHDTIGIDLVAMCANDLVCVGAAPSLFLDYFAVGHLENQSADAIMKGIVEGCDQAGMILAGGETAELPGLYKPGHYDLAGFAVGHVTRDKLITGNKIKPGQKLVGVASSGIHSNGLSLARKVLPQEDKWLNLLLEPTLIYVKAVLAALSKHGDAISGICHITGGGWRNLLRLNKEAGFTVTSPLLVPEVFHKISEHVESEEMYKTFNMGMGLALIVEKEAELVADLFKEHGFSAAVVGETTDEFERIRIKGFDFVLKDKHS